VPNWLAFLSPSALRTRTFRLWTLWRGISPAPYPDPPRNVSLSSPPYPVAHPSRCGRRSVATQFAPGGELQHSSEPTTLKLDNLISFKRLRAKAQQVIRETKQTSCKAFISRLSRSTHSGVVYYKLRRMLGKYSRTITPGLSAGGAVLTSQADVANIIASFFSTLCSSDYYDPDFRATKNSAETFPLNFTPRVAEAYDIITTDDELLATSYRCRNTSPGPDGILNETLSHLPPAGKEFLLSVYKCIRTERPVPDTCSQTCYRSLAGNYLQTYRPHYFPVRHWSA
jgi:hypothetical protein